MSIMIPHPHTLVAFGDSITQAVQQPENLRWVALLNDLLKEAWKAPSLRIINAGVGGNTSREGLARLDPDVLCHHPDLVLVEFGGNDATFEEHRHVSQAEYRTNLETMRRALVDQAKGEMVILTFPPVIDAWHANGRHEYYTCRGGQDAFIETYRAVSRDFAREHGLRLVDIDRALRNAMIVEGPERYILQDGVHLTADGNAVVARAIFTVLHPGGLSGS